jgi:16S rRNA (adenine1518-N6/adenine1519-N6)-dimethyltransferase
MALRARKRFGQHFLEPAWVDRVVRVIDPEPDQDFIEIGPGRGALTRPLAARAHSVLAFEIDRDLVRELRGTMPSNVTVIEGDFLALHDKAHDPNPHSLTNPESRIANPDASVLRVAANLPYNVASPILFELIRQFDEGVPLVDATLMLQREVADRLLAEPGTKEYGVLTILVGHSATVTRRLELPPGAFRPAPNVRSTVVQLRFHAPDPPVRDRTSFGALVQAVFTRRRKTIQNALQAYERAHGASLPSWLDPRRRPETLSIAEYARLSNDFGT